MSGDEVASTMDADDIDDTGSVQSDFNLETFLGEVINTPKLQPSAPLWTKASSNRQVLYGRSGAELVEAKSVKYDFNVTAGTAKATGLVKPNYYSPLWFEDADPAVAQWQYDLEVRSEKDDETCMECAQIAAATPAYVSMVTPFTMVYEVESMTRLELFKCVDSFLENLSSRPPLD
ncbi:unnamed protein product [Peronospora destructor]|uniref:Uncharacterized protein n=1 Tax=Peronospora destructor TaxID=86335 RepID=A0AAV0T3P2_9STRA|nr:unnamed protein product [Peronospora destructor]